MSCNCIKEIEGSFIKRYESRADMEKVTNVSIENAAIMFSEGLGIIELYSPVKIEYDYKNGKGETKHKKEKANMSYKYCPFCGKEYAESEVK